jgi:S1-C subfamily serine protease
MAFTLPRLRPLLRVALPVVTASVLVALAVMNVALVRTWTGEVEDGVLWRQQGANVVAAEVAPVMAGGRAGIRAGDVLVAIDGREVRAVSDVGGMLSRGRVGQTVRYVVLRSSVEQPVTLELETSPTARQGLYYCSPWWGCSPLRLARRSGCGGRSIALRCTSTG